MVVKKQLIAPSILAADFGNMAAAIRLAEDSGADWIHLDVMDGCFVPPISFGAQMVSAIRSLTTLPLDAHLMTVHPANHVKSFADAGTDILTFHVEGEVHANRLAGEIRSSGMKAGISIVPSTPVSVIQDLLPFIDQVLVMTVNPGWGGQGLIPETLMKIKKLAQLRNDGAEDFLIVMDGGFSPQTSSEIWRAGTDVAVMGSAFFGAENPAEAMRRSRDNASHADNLE